MKFHNTGLNKLAARLNEKATEHTLWSRVVSEKGEELPSYLLTYVEGALKWMIGSIIGPTSVLVCHQYSPPCKWYMVDFCGIHCTDSSEFTGGLHTMNPLHLHRVHRL